jgi:hypothetical protein
MQAREMILKGLSVEVNWSKVGHHTSARVPAVELAAETRDPNTKTQDEAIVWSSEISLAESLTKHRREIRRST